jgi:GTP cyclohydrolase IA
MSEKYLSDIIRSKMQRDGKRFFACDNISEYLDDETRNGLVSELTIKFNEVLKSLLIDTENDPNSSGTGKRLAKMYVNEIMAGRYYPSPDCTAFPNDGTDSYKGMLVVRSELKSMCSHHHQPVTGVAYIGIIPGNKVIGLSKYTRIAQWHARRGTLQEELCTHIASSIMAATESEDVAVYLKMTHGCCENRGISAHDSTTQTTVLHGQFHTSDVKKEFFDNVQIQEFTKR